MLFYAPIFVYTRLDENLGSGLLLFPFSFGIRYYLFFQILNEFKKEDLYSSLDKHRWSRNAFVRSVNGLVDQI